MNAEELRKEEKAFTLGDNYPDCIVCGNKIFPTDITVDCVSCNEQVHAKCSKLTEADACKALIAVRG
jgi:hypothetical protein